MNESPSAVAAAIDPFIDALWLEDGLSPNTLAAYRRDLTLYASWLEETHELPLVASREHHLQAYFAARAASRATSANRRLTVLRRYFRWALRERLIDADPTLRLLAARQPLPGYVLSVERWPGTPEILAFRPVPSTAR